MNKFKVSFEGLIDAINHKAVRIQLILGVMAVIGGIIIKLDYYEWLAFIVCIGMVITTEIMNTAVEKIGDYLNKEYDTDIKLIKDLSSGAVLASSLMALAVCLFCVFRRIL
ncbi:MAG: diacylglycerol kinase family protein [Erysipelotrichaceae bacterium]|nr:diacylglycerol kinase family protein [Erysipelotrichaceae bacterium]